MNDVSEAEAARRYWHAVEVMKLGLDGFANDPPDSEGQQGYFEALHNFALEGLGMNLDRPQPTKRFRPKLTVITGGR
jgi:hypothetical protein